MYEEGIVVIAAGSETIVRTLTTTTFFLLLKLNALIRLKKELTEVTPFPKFNTNLKNFK